MPGLSTPASNASVARGGGGGGGLVGSVTPRSAIARKRQLTGPVSSSRSSIGMGMDHTSDTLEPPKQRVRRNSHNNEQLIIGGNGNSNSNSNGSSNAGSSGGSDVYRVQLETLQAELDHERSLRALDQKRHYTTQQRLERQVQFAVEEAKDTQSILDELRTSSDQYVQTLKDKHQRLQHQYQELQENYEQQQQDMLSNSRSDDPRLKLLQARLDAREEENQGLADTIEGLQKEIGDLLQQRQSEASRTPQKLTNDGEPAAATTTATNPVLLASPAPPQVMKELNHVRLQLQDTERQNRQLERQMKELQGQTKEFRRLQMVQSSATSRVVQLESQLQDRDQSLALTQAQLESWKKFGKDIGQSLLEAVSTSSSSSVSKKIKQFGTSDVPPEISVIQRYLQEATQEARKAQTQQASLTKQLEQTDTQLQKLKSECRELEQSKTVLQSELQDAQQVIKVTENKCKILKQQEAVWEREATTLRSIVRTFDELPLTGKTPAKNTETSQPPKAVAMLQASLQAAQEELKVVRNAKDNIQEKLDNVLKEKIELQSKHGTVLEKFAKLREAVYAERNKAEKAEARAIQAETLAGKGSFNPETTRVLHLQSNPLTEALKQEIAVLRRQIEALNKKSKKSTAGGTGSVSGVLTPGADVDPNKLHQRLKQSFKEQIGRFREGVYLLTGFKIDMIPEGDHPKFKVRSMFAEREDDHLMFQWPNSMPVESLDLLDTHLAKVLMTTPSYEYVTRFASLPAFLASTQLSLFEKQTMV